MESVSPRKKKYRGKKKPKSSRKNGQNEAVVKPECFDGMTNWLQLQKVLEKTKERVPESTKRSGSENSFKRPHKKMRSSHSKSEMFANGKSNDSPVKFKDKSLISSSDQNVDPESDLKELTKVLALDCEMVGTGPDGKDSVLARVSIVNAYGQCVYDEFVKPKERVTDFRTQISGVRPSDLKKGKELIEVQKEVLAMIEGRRLVGHDLKHDFAVLFISHPRGLIRDTSKYKPFREVSGGKTPSLKKLSSVLLKCDIQGSEHSSVEDAQAAMLIYLRHKKEWERHLKSTRKRRPTQ